MGNIKNKVVVLTGAGGRLGTVILRHLGQAGARIAGVVMNEKEAQRVQFPPNADTHLIQTNLTDETATSACFAAIHDHFGRIDALIHTAGTWGMKPLVDTTLTEWQTMLDTNLTTTFLCFREAARWMLQGEGSDHRLIAFSARPGTDGGVAQQGAYAASKAGVLRLIEAVAQEYEGQGITTHGLAPSMILYDGMADQQGVRADDLAALCVQLCGPLGAALNGHVLRTFGSLR